MSSSAGKVLLRPRGTYDASATYLVLDWVLYQGKPYVAKDTTTGNLPTDTTHWQILLDFPTQFDNVPTEGSSNLVNSGTVYTALAGKQNSLTFDNAPTQNSDNPVKSGGVYSALAGKQDALTFDSSPTQNSDNPVKSGGVYTALGNKQDTLTFDSSPTQNSNNPVKSGGVYTALAGKQNTLTFDNSPTSGSNNPVKSGGVYTALAGKQDTLTFDNSPTANSNNPVKSGGVHSALQNAGHTIKDETTTFTKRANLKFKGFKVTDDAANNSTVVEMPLDPSTVSWANGSDEDIATMLEMHYNGEIDIHDYWAVGDERKISLSAMEATGVGESHAAQEVTMVLMDAGKFVFSSDHQTPCAFVVGQKNALIEKGYMNSSLSSVGGWDGCKRRTWCNNVYRNAIPESIRSIFKQFDNQASNGNTSSPQTITSSDYFSFFSGTEATPNTYDSTRPTIQYYKTAANRGKYEGDSSSTLAWWWLRDPQIASYNNAYVYFSVVKNTGELGTNSANQNIGIAPFGCI